MLQKQSPDMEMLLQAILDIKMLLQQSPDIKMPLQHSPEMEMLRQPSPEMDMLRQQSPEMEMLRRIVQTWRCFCRKSPEMNASVAESRYGCFLSRDQAWMLTQQSPDMDASAERIQT